MRVFVRNEIIWGPSRLWTPMNVPSWVYVEREDGRILLRFHYWYGESWDVPKRDREHPCTGVEVVAPNGKILQITLPSFEGYRKDPLEEGMAAVDRHARACLRAGDKENAMAVQRALEVLREVL